MLFRSIFDIIYDDAKYKNTKQLQDFIAKEINSDSTDPESLKMALMQYARDNSANMMKLNIETQKMAEPKIATTGVGFGGETRPSTNPFNFGWTGD